MNSLSIQDKENSFIELKGLKIIFLFGSLDLGGAERQGLLLANFLKNECLSDVHVWALNSKPGRLSELCDQCGISWRGIKFHWGLKRGLNHFFEFPAQIRKQRPDVLISYTGVPNIVCALVWKLSGARLCVWNQADEGLLLNKGPLHRLAVKLPNCFISNSTGGKDFLVRTYGFNPDEIKVIPNGIPIPVPLADRGVWRKRLGLDANSFVACMVANLSVYKDHATLLRAWQEVVTRTKCGFSLVLLLAGRFDGSEIDLERLCEELDIVDKVRFLGKVDDIDGLLNAADLFTYSSKSEGIPNAVLEAMAAGLPVVATDIPGIRDAVGPDGFRFLSRVGDYQAFADRIILFVNDAVLRQNAGIQFKKRAIAEFNIDRMCRNTAEILCAALREKPR